MKGNNGGRWSGIEVWGDSTLQQQQVNGAYLQGYLELKNGAVIEDALCAVNLQNPLDNTTTGGIVHATGALFRNNAKAVHIGHYTGHDEISGGELSYNSWFRDCVFVIDGNYLGDATFNSHVSLDGVDGVTFSGCSFSADRGVTGVSPTCYGIDAYNSLFMVNQYCGSLTRPCPEQDLVRSSFSGFHQGVHAVGDGQRLSTPLVYQSDFSDNDIGVYCRATGFATMVGGSVAMGDDADCAIGLYADGVTGLTVEENDFGTSSGNNTGTWSGIQPTQGSPRASAGNTFSGSQYHIYNDGDYQLTYYYDNTEPDQIPASSKLHGVTATASTGGNRCLSHLGGQPSKGPDADMADPDADSWEELVGKVRDLLSDTIVVNAALRGLLMRFGSLDTDRLSVASLMAEGDTAGAIALAETLSDKYGFTGNDLAEHGDYMRLLYLYRDLRRTGRTVTELTAEELSLAEKIAETGTGIPRTMAETLLERGGGGHNVDFCPTDYVVVHRDGTAGKGIGTDGIAGLGGVSNSMCVNVSPSPATTAATVEYVLTDGATHATLVLVNTLGVKMLAVELEGNRGNEPLDLSGQPSGIYFIIVTDQNGQRCVRKVIRH